MKLLPLNVKTCHLKKKEKKRDISNHYIECVVYKPVMYARRIDLYGDDMTRVGEQEDIYRCAYIYSFARNRERNKHVLKYIFIYMHIFRYILMHKRLRPQMSSRAPTGKAIHFFFLLCVCVCGGELVDISMYI